jgi:microsomal dipeptidase-like Zn-dependent dipeptidase
MTGDPLNDTHMYPIDQRGVSWPVGRGNVEASRHDAAAARALVCEVLGWDNHACLPLRPDDHAFFSRLATTVRLVDHNEHIASLVGADHVGLRLDYVFD